MKFLKKIFVPILLIALLAGISVPVRAKAEGDSAPCVYLGLYSSASNVMPGRTSSIKIGLENMQEVSAVNFTIYYDAEKLTASSISSYFSQGDLVYDYEKKNAGQIDVSLMALDGINDIDIGLIASMKVSNGVQAGNTSLTIAVSEAYDLEGRSIEISKRGLTLNIIASEEASVTPDLYFNNRFTVSSGYQGDTLTYKLMVNDENKLFASGNFNFTYDSEKLAVKTVTLGAPLTTNGASAQTNTERAGLVKVSYLNPTPVKYYSGTSLIMIVFDILADEETTTQVAFYGDSFYDVDLNPYNARPANNTTVATLHKKIVEPVIEHHFMTLLQGDDTADEFQTMSVTLDGNSGVEAGDFRIAYDNTKLNVMNVEVGSDATLKGAYVMARDGWDKNSGVINFSYMKDGALTEDLTLLNVTFKALGTSSFNSAVTVTGTGVVDGNFAPVALEYKNVELSCTPPYQPGDVDQNGTINGDDMIALAKHIAKLAVITNAESLKACDMNKDGKVDSADVTSLASYINGKNK